MRHSVRMKGVNFCNEKSATWMTGDNDDVCLCVYMCVCICVCVYGTWYLYVCVFVCALSFFNNLSMAWITSKTNTNLYKMSTRKKVCHRVRLAAVFCQTR